MGRLRRYRTAFRRYRHSKGFGIHSPFAFRFVLNVLRERNPYYAYSGLAELRHSVIVRTRHHLRHPRIISLKNAKLIFRVVNYFNPRQVLQIGTSYGVSSVSILAVSSRIRLVLCEAHLGDYPVVHDVLSAYTGQIAQNSNVQDAISRYKEELLAARSGNVAAVDDGREMFACSAGEPFVLVNNLYDEAEYAEVKAYLAEVLSGKGVVIMRNLSRSQLMMSLWRECRDYATYGMTFSNEKVAIIVANPKLPRQDFSMWF